MPSTHHEHLAIGEVADQAAHAIQLLNHRTRPATSDLAEPSDAAEVIAALAAMTGMLPQLLGQLACWLQSQHHHGQLRVDDLAPLPDTAHTVHSDVMTCITVRMNRRAQVGNFFFFYFFLIHHISLTNMLPYSCEITASVDRMGFLRLMLQLIA